MKRGIFVVFWKPRTRAQRWVAHNVKVRTLKCESSDSSENRNGFRKGNVIPPSTVSRLVSGLVCVCWCGGVFEILACTKTQKHISIGTSFVYCSPELCKPASNQSTPRIFPSDQNHPTPSRLGLEPLCRTLILSLLITLPLSALYHVVC